MIRRILALLVLCVCAQAATHYVSSTTGVNNGTGSIGAPWQTLAYAMSNVAAGDTVLLLRGDVWNEALVISQNNLTLDAYGSGPAPRITGYQALTTWASQGSNVWSAPVASGTTCSPSAGSVLFNEVIGQRQSAQNAVLHDRDFWCNSGTSIYVYAASSPSTYYGRVAAITPSGNGNSLISIAGKTGITIQHLQLDYFDGYGVYVSGAATNLTFANMSVNGILIGENPFVTIAGSRPYGFYVATGTSATTISFVNVDAHLNYDGFRFDSYGAGSQIMLTGCRAFANRDVGIFDATTGTSAVTYNYTHLYANGITTIESTDATGNVIAGSGNRPANEAPVVQGLDRFPALFSFTIDDVGLSAGTETYIDTLTPVFDARGLKMNMAATAGFNPNTTEMAAWATAGHEIDSHSWSHEYYTNVGDSTSSQNMFALQYGSVGTKTAATGTAATMTISGNPLTLSTIVTGGPGGQNLIIDLTTMRAAASSPEHAAGPTVGINDAIRSYNVDILGGMRPVPGTWDIGAYPSALWGTQHGSSGTSKTTIYGKYVGVSQENIYCGPGDVPSFGSTDGPASLPQQCTYTAMAGTPSPGTVRTVTSCSDIASKLASVSNNSGDTVVIPASLGTCVGTWGPTYQGDAAHWLTIRTDQIAATGFPGEGVQATPCAINIAHIDGYPDYSCASPAVLMPTLSSGSTNVSTLTLTNCKYCRVIGLNITKNYGTAMANSLVTMDYSDHVILDRVLVHGDNWDLHLADYPPTGYDYNHSTRGGVSARGTYQAVINSWVYDIDSNTDDGWAIGGGTGGQPDEGPLKLYNNLLAGASETWMFGGGTEPFAYPHDFEFRHNLAMKPLKWMIARGRGCGGSGGTCVRVKNLGEFKYGQRVLYEDNVFLNNWEGQADQWGEALLIFPKNQGNSTNTKRVNTSSGDGGVTYKNMACASDSSGTPCAAGTGVWGNNITDVSRSGGHVTLHGANNGAGWPNNFAVRLHIVVQGLPHTLASGSTTVYLDSLNGDYEMDCLDNVNHINCTSGYSNPNVIYFTAAGDDFGVTVPSSGMVQAFTASTCPAGGCRFACNDNSTGSCVAGTNYNFPQQHIASVIDTEHITTVENMGAHTGAAQTSCYPGLAPYAQVNDVTFRNNYVTHSNSIGMSIQNVATYCGDITRGVSNVSIHDNVADDIDAPAWSVDNNAANTHGATGPKVDNQYADPATWPRGISYAHNTWANTRTWPNIPVYSAWNYAFNLQDTYGSTYFANVTYRDNIFPGPMATTIGNGNLLAGGVTAGFNKYLCSGHDGVTGCTWLYKNNLMGTAVNGSSYLQQNNSPYPTTNPDSSPICTISGGCNVTDFSGVFTGWGANKGLGDTSGNDYSVTPAYQGKASDGSNPGADTVHWKTVRSAVLPHFTYAALATTAQTMTCTHAVYCEQQLTWSGGAGPFVQWHLCTVALCGTASNPLPAGMTLSNGDGWSSCQINGTYSKNGTTGCAGWVWGTPTQTGSYSLTFQAEDAAHQKASVNLTLTVN